MAEITWIKLNTTIFEDEKINFIESLPDSDTLIVIWLKILTLAGKINDGGFIYLTDKIPYTVEMLSNKFNRPQNTVKLALETFQKLEMIELVGDKIFISKWEKHQSVDEMAKIKEQTRLRVKAHRDKKQFQLPCNVTVTLPVTQCNATEREIERDKEKDIYSVKKIDPYCNPYKSFFETEYEKILGTRPYLQKAHCEKLCEIAEGFENFKDIVPVALEKLKKINFKDINFKPSAPWLLEKENFAKVLNGEFDEMNKGGTNTKGVTSEQIKKLFGSQQKEIVK